ncbi:hypothetical protein RSOLAG22IIIB_05857 [Rhizoctonia solani]|uniref:MYND-type domain-containing protein n=1 Tax=Rhizoctonia solani TaxID=456999 RepID=A0A0K6G9Q8_9AGAM|nr:hypothetical protein RSOLAG22IIIB_05857 [Rhizoctonia solani]
MLNFHASKLWKDAPIKIRSELADSRLMMLAYINQLKLGIQPIDNDETSLPMADIPDTLYFLYRHFVPGCQDMIPELIGTTIERCWVAFLNPSKLTIFLVEFMGMLSWFRAFIGCFDQPHPDNQNLKLKALTHAMGSDLMDLIGRVMVFIDPTPKEPKDIDDNEKLLKECENIFIELSYLPPGSELENYFVDRGVGWWKFYWHLRYLARLPGDRSKFYGRCAYTWAAMRPSIDMEDLASTTEYYICGYDRCSNPEVPWGLEYACDICKTHIYCSITCFQKDWESGATRRLRRANGSCAHASR